MSLVGPRPEVAKYVDLYRNDYAEILQVRPGITDAASLKYRDEAALLGAADDADAFYRTHILPDKIALAKAYVREGTFGQDLRILFRTAFGL
jgi:lipopolysaccharide/colanic/teichoic acid biosynthesis glycosyltransferase